MKYLLGLTLILTGACSYNQPRATTNNTCPPDWVATDKVLTQNYPNDSTEQLFLNDSLWFEVINLAPYKNEEEISYIKLYRTNGRLEAEGFATYDNHPIADYTEIGKWIYYNCLGKFDYTKDWQSQ